MKYNGLTDSEVKTSREKMVLILSQIQNQPHFGMNSKRPLEIL